jgi:hypothetical protein
MTDKSEFDELVSVIFANKLHSTSTYFLHINRYLMGSDLMAGRCELNGMYCHQTEKLDCRNCNLPMIELAEKLGVSRK